VPSAGIDPVYFDSPYYVYPDGPIAVEALRVIGAATAEAGVVGLGASHRQPARTDGYGGAARYPRRDGIRTRKAL
jgi:hypothetical protein